VRRKGQSLRRNREQPVREKEGKGDRDGGSERGGEGAHIMKMRHCIKPGEVGKERIKSPGGLRNRLD